MTTIAKNINALQRPGSKARPDAIDHLQLMLTRLATWRDELEQGNHRSSPPDPLPADPVAPRTHDMNGNRLSRKATPSRHGHEAIKTTSTAVLIAVQ
jgi:hypothetical protein